MSRESHATVRVSPRRVEVVADPPRAESRLLSPEAIAWTLLRPVRPKEGKSERREPEAKSAAQSE